jgi:hypothetical protein
MMTDIIPVWEAKVHMRFDDSSVIANTDSSTNETTTNPKTAAKTIQRAVSPLIAFL